MNKLEQLIKELCPNGVEYKKLSDIATVARGVRVVRDQLAETGDIPVYQNSIKPLGYHDKSNVKAYSAFVIGAGAAGEIGFSDVDFWAADDCYYFLCPDNLNNRYLYFVLMKNQPLILSRVRKASIPRLSRTVIENLVIPVPPLAVQAEIVKILDEYSTSVTALQQELEKELTARKKQYEYYRDLLLDFGGSRQTDAVHGGGTGECEWRTIKEVCDTITNFAAAGSFAEVSKNVPYLSDPDYAQLVRTVDLKSDFKNQNPIYVSKHSYDYLWRVNLDNIAIVLPSVGNCGEVYYIEPDKLPYKHNVLAKNALLIRSTMVDMKFLKFIFESRYFQKALKKITSNMGQSKFNKTDFEKLFVPVPQKEEQKRIVSILDRFDKLCNDISEGLPAEIEARRKQYEYYRDKLLTFNVKENAI